MKKFLVPLISGIIISSLTTASKAQTLNVSADGLIENPSSKTTVSKANSRAENNFKKHFETGPDVKWFNEKETITASMDRDGKHTNVVYDRKGRWLHTISNYDETKLSRDLRKMIKMNYFDYDLTLVQEIEEGQTVFYIFHLDNKTDYKQVAYYEGELVVLKEFKKQQK